MITQEVNTAQTTEKRTLWSETLLEMLYDSVEYDWSANAVREILFELHQKGYKISRVMKKVNKKFGKGACTRLLQKINE